MVRRVTSPKMRLISKSSRCARKIAFLLFVLSFLDAGQSNISRYATAQAGEFLVAVLVQPNYYFRTAQHDVALISKMANAIFVQAGKYKSYQQKYLKPTLDLAQQYQLKVFLEYYAIQDGDTNLETLVTQFGSHPAVLGFKVMDELGGGHDAAYWANFLKQRRDIIRAHSDKPILVDIIPWSFWAADNVWYKVNYQGASSEAIDRYVSSGLIDILILSVDVRYATISRVLPEAEGRWGRQVKIMSRTSGSFKGETYEGAGMSAEKVRLVTQAAIDARSAGAIGIYYYAWQHDGYRILNRDGSSNPLYEALVDNFKLLQSVR